jgi:dsDNA-specific endonuclease/ATPase MutS2
MKEAQAKRLTKIVFIHGVGEGVLRSEIRHELRKYENVEFLDGDYREYGQGATEVRLWYK